MTTIDNQITETWRIHNRILLFMIKNISDEAMKATLSTRGGRDVARQLAHVHMVRVWRLEPFSKKFFLVAAGFTRAKLRLKRNREGCAYRRIGLLGRPHRGQKGISVPIWFLLHSEINSGAVNAKQLLNREDAEK